MLLILVNKLIFVSLLLTRKPKFSASAAQKGQDNLGNMCRNKNKQMFVKHLPPARSEYRVPQRPITKTGTKEGQLTQRYY